MSLLDDIKAKADQNGDGKLSTADLESFRNGDNGSIIDKLKDIADHNGDGKVGLDDLKNIDFGTVVSSIKDKFFGGK